MHVRQQLLDPEEDASTNIPSRRFFQKSYFGRKLGMTLQKKASSLRDIMKRKPPSEDATALLSNSSDKDTILYHSRLTADRVLGDGEKDREREVRCDRAQHPKSSPIMMPPNPEKTSEQEEINRERRPSYRVARKRRRSTRRLSHSISSSTDEDSIQMNSERSVLISQSSRSLSNSLSSSFHRNTVSSSERSSFSSPRGRLVKSHRRSKNNTEGTAEDTLRKLQLALSPEPCVKPRLRAQLQ